MALLIGTDEAGYGPNLGPLLIGVTAWRVPDALIDVDLYTQLQGVVHRAPEEGGLAIADSKALYKPGGGVAALELGVLAALSQRRTLPLTWRKTWRALCPESRSPLHRLPWYAGFDAAIPTSCELTPLNDTTDRLRDALHSRGIQLVEQQAVAIFPHQFNALVRKLGSKGAALSESTLRLVRQVIDRHRDQKTVVQCDKHGGRNRYGPLLQTEFPDYLVEVLCESRAESIYRWGPPDRRCECRFVAKGESFLPAALASMTAKYLRELAMLAFNAFWCERLPEIRPTAGYPVDARRFRAQIEPLRAELGIADDQLWRER